MVYVNLDRPSVPESHALLTAAAMIRGGSFPGDADDEYFVPADPASAMP
jgi:hypothetical protein